MDIIELTRDGLRKKGTWNTTEGVNLTSMINLADTGLSDKPDLRNMTFIVLIAIVSITLFLKIIYVFNFLIRE